MSLGAGRILNYFGPLGKSPGTFLCAGRGTIDCGGRGAARAALGIPKPAAIASRYAVLTPTQWQGETMGKPQSTQRSQRSFILCDLCVLCGFSLLFETARMCG